MAVGGLRWSLSWIFLEKAALQSRRTPLEHEVMRSSITDSLLLHLAGVPSPRPRKDTLTLNGHTETLKERQHWLAVDLTAEESPSSRIRTVIPFTVHDSTMTGRVIPVMAYFSDTVGTYMGTVLKQLINLLIDIKVRISCTRPQQVLSLSISFQSRSARTAEVQSASRALLFSHCRLWFGLLMMWGWWGACERRNSPLWRIIVRAIRWLLRF